MDDEKNIRLTLSQALEPLGLPVQTVVNGEEALQKLQKEEFAILLLDLKLPGINGLEVLHRVRQKWPKIRVIIITAYGTIESAVEAMKLGAVDYLQKPCSPGEIRELVTQVLAREELSEENLSEYTPLIQLSKRYITDGQFDDARRIIQKAIATEPGQPEAYNLLGAILEIKGDIIEAQKFYRLALSIDPTYKPAWANLDRTASWHQFGQINLGAGSEKTTTPDKGRDGTKK